MDSSDPDGGMDAAGKAGFEPESDFEYLLGFLPAGWEAKAKELGALRRARKFPNAQVLLRVLLIHLAEGCSLRETAVRAREGGLVRVSDVAVLERLHQAGEWFRWLATELMARWVVRQPVSVYGARFNVRVADATQVSEPGPTGSTWRIHYAIGLPSLRCTAVEVTDSEGAGTGESFAHFGVEPGDLFMGDRAYGLARGIAHVVQGGGDVLVRFAWSNLSLWETPRRPLDLLKRLRTLRGTALGDWPAGVRYEGRFIPGRVCAIKKSRAAAQKAREAVRRKARKHSAQTLAQTLEAADYLFVFTTVAPARLGPGRILEFYRGRWQVELVFKRLKSLLALGHLRKTDDEGARAWLHGKLFVAFLLEVLLTYGESFFPWGYPLRDA